jgi:hypothetical protein
MEVFESSKGDEIIMHGYMVYSSIECKTIMIVMLPVKSGLGSSLDWWVGMGFLDGIWSVWFGFGHVGE